MLSYIYILGIAPMLHWLLRSTLNRLATGSGVIIYIAAVSIPVFLYYLLKKQIGFTNAVSISAMAAAAGLLVGG